MSTPVMGIAEDSTLEEPEVYRAALALGIANQLTNILRDVGEDMRRYDHSESVNLWYLLLEGA